MPWGLSKLGLDEFVMFSWWYLDDSMRDNGTAGKASGVSANEIGWFENLLLQLVSNLPWKPALNQQATCSPTNPISAETSCILATPSLPGARHMLVPSGNRCDPARQTHVHTHPKSTRMHTHTHTYKRINAYTSAHTRVLAHAHTHTHTDTYTLWTVWRCVTVCYNVLQCVAVCCSVLQCVAMCCSVLQCVAVRCE